jgi:hypothetical protein
MSLKIEMPQQGFKNHTLIRFPLVPEMIGGAF